MKDGLARSGYELAAKILETHPNDAIEVMLRYSNGAECDWLEFKAGMTLLPEDVAKGDKPDDLYWDYLLSIVAMANTRGGAFVIGVIDTTHKPLPLSVCDPRHVLESEGKEGYLRKEVLDRIDRCERTWKTKDGTTWSLNESIAPHIEGRFMPFDGTDVLVLLVKPVDIGKELYIGQKIKSDVFESLPIRHLGEAGKVKRLTKRADWDSYIGTREITSGQFGTWWAELDAEAAASREQEKIEEAITEYYQRQTQKARQLMAVFTPLDAEENVFGGEGADLFYSPEAIETIENDDWLDDDEEGNGQESEGREYRPEEDGFEGDSNDEYDDESDGESGGKASGDSMSRVARKGDLLELLKAESRVIVSGEPGGGKTTCLTYYALQHAKAGGAGRILAVFIPMGQWKKGGSLGKMMSGVTGLDAAQLHHLIVENRLLLVIDAVNECPDVYRVAAINDIGVFLARNPTVRAVISTRHPNELSQLNLPVFHVQPMGDEQRRRYLAHYLGDEDEAERLLRQIGTMPGGDTIAENPMLLRLVVEVYRGAPAKRLPNGRAGLYRRSLHAWYKREKTKAKKADIRLDWNEHKTIEVLAELAFNSRLAGYRDVPLEEASTIWGGNSDQQITELCQGPIIYLDNGFLRFRHETFQEYLCAEYLVAHPSKLPMWTEVDYARWGMPFAYVVELFEQEQKQLPESFWLAAWDLNPWLGVALTTTSQIRGTLCVRWKDTIYLRIIRGKLKWVLRQTLYATPSLWYSRNDVALRYVVEVSQRCQATWAKFERSQLSCLKGLRVDQAMILAKSWITLKNPREIFRNHAPKEWGHWVEDATIERAISLIDTGIAKPSDFDSLKKKKKSLKNISLKNGVELLDYNLLTINDLKDKIHGWLAQEMTMAAQPMLIKLGVVLKGTLSDEDFHSLTTYMSLSVVCVLINRGIVKTADVEDRIPRWINDASIKVACLLVDTGVATQDDFQAKLSQWVNVATPEMACEMVKHGIADMLDFKERLSKWLKCTQYSFMRDFALECKAEGFYMGQINQETVQMWVENASIDDAILLVKDGWCKQDDFRSRFLEWKDTSDVRILKGLKEIGLCEDEVFRLVEEHKRIRHACQKAEDGLTDSSVTNDNLLHWSFIVDVSTLGRMISCGLLDMEDCTARIKGWVEKASPKMAILLLRNKMATDLDFPRLIKQWGNRLTPKVAERLIGYNVISRNDIEDMKDFWLNTMSPDTLLSVMNLGFLSFKEAVRIQSLWGINVIGGGYVRENFASIVQSLDLYLGRVVQGRVRNVSEYGVFVDIGGIDGLVRISELSCSCHKDAMDSLHVGDEVGVKIISIDSDNNRIELSIKQCQGNPWDTVQDRYLVGEKYKVGTIVNGKVKRIASFGAFIELEEGIDGLVHISQMSEYPIGKVKDVLQVGQEVEARVVKVDSEASRIGLSMRAVSMSDDRSKVLVEELNSAENVKLTYTYALLAKEGSRRETVANLKGKTFEAYCKVGNGTYGYLHHPDFEGQIYIDIPVTNGVQIHEGQKWRFEAGAHCLPPNGLWIYRARKATLIEESAPVADLPSGPQMGKSTRYYSLAEIAIQQQRENIEKELERLEFDAICIKSCGTFGFLGHVPFEGNLFIHQSLTNGTPILKGQKWRVKVGTLLDSKKMKWCYNVKSGHTF